MKAAVVHQFGRPPGELGPLIFDAVLNRKTIRGSIAGARLDLQEALGFAGKDAVKSDDENLPGSRPK